MVVIDSSITLVIARLNCTPPCPVTKQSGMSDRASSVTKSADLHLFQHLRTKRCRSLYLGAWEVLDNKFCRDSTWCCLDSYKRFELSPVAQFQKISPHLSCEYHLLRNICFFTCLTSRLHYQRQRVNSSSPLGPHYTTLTERYVSDVSFCFVLTRRFRSNRRYRFLSRALGLRTLYSFLELYNYGLLFWYW